MKEEVKVGWKYKANELSFDDVTPEQVSALIVGTAKAFDTARGKAQRTAVALMVLSVNHSAEAITLSNTLVHCLGDGVKGEGMVKFLRDMGGFQLNADGKAFEGVKNEEWIRANLNKAKAKMWWTYVPAKPFAGFNLNAEIAKVLDKATAQVGKLDKRTDKEKELVEIDVAMLRTMQSLIGGAPVMGEDALALVQKLVPSVVIPFPSKAEDKASEAIIEHPELPAEQQG